MLSKMSKKKSKPSLQQICIVLAYLTLKWSGKKTNVSLILDFMCIFCFDVSVRVDCDSQQCLIVFLRKMLVHLKAFFCGRGLCVCLLWQSSK